MINSHLLYRLSYPGMYSKLIYTDLISIFNTFLHFFYQDQSGRFLPRTGLEPAHLTAPGSKPGVSTNSTISAYIQELGFEPSTFWFRVRRSTKWTTPDWSFFLVAGDGVGPPIFGLWARRDTVSLPRIKLGKPGFEPGLTESKSAVLPLDDFPISYKIV